MTRRILLTILCLLSPLSAWAASLTYTYTEPTASGTLRSCTLYYCTGTANCTPQQPVTGGTIASDDNNGGDTKSTVAATIELQSGQTHACFLMNCIDTARSKSANTARVCCTGGVCS